jgi:Na+/melibiose symporter-like transporter
MDDREPTVDEPIDFSETASRWKWWAIAAGVGLTVVLVLLSWFLYSLGDADESALERLQSIAVIYIVLLFLIVVVLLAAMTAALVFLVFQIKDRVIPLLEEATMTAKRVRGTTEFVTEEAVKPILTVAGKYAKLRAMQRTVTGKSTKPPKI